MFLGRYLELRHAQVSVSLATFLVRRSVAENIHFPLSIIASQQLTQLEDQLHTLLINSDSDQWRYIWGISFTSKKHAYTKPSWVHFRNSNHTNGYGKVAVEGSTNSFSAY
jgi:hypothetical protein